MASAPTGAADHLTIDSASAAIDNRHFSVTVRESDSVLILNIAPSGLVILFR